MISGDALTDIDLTDLVEFHQEKGALVTVCLTRVPDPLEFGITIVDDEGRVQRFLEKPTWGQVFSDTVNTGIYVMEPEVLDHVAAGESVDWSGDVFPQLLEEGAPIYGYVAEGYWEDVGTHECYLQGPGRRADRQGRRRHRRLRGLARASGSPRAPTCTPTRCCKGPLYIGDYAKVEAGAELREYTVLGSNVVVKSGAFLHRAVVHDNVFIGPQTNLRGCVIGKNTDVMRGGPDRGGRGHRRRVRRSRRRRSSPAASRSTRSRPSRPARSSTPASSGSRAASAPCSGRAASPGIVNVEITPELAVRLAGAYATTLKKGADRHHRPATRSRAARALKRAVISRAHLQRDRRARPRGRARCRWPG